MVSNAPPFSGSRQAAWEFFGTELKRLREEAGLTQVELGARVFVSGPYIGQFEQAIRKPQLDIAKRIDEVLQTGGFFARLCRKLIDDQRYAEYFASVADLEVLASCICDYAPTVVPGLLQTPAYAQAVTVANNPFVTNGYVKDKVSARVQRAAVLESETRPEFWAILHENVLRIPVGGPLVMAEQLEHITQHARARTAVVLVVPYSAGAHSAMNGTLRLMEFPDAPPTAYTETSFSGTLVDEPTVVRRVRRAYDLLRASALSPEASLAMIEAAAEDFKRCAGTT